MGIITIDRIKKWSEKQDIAKLIDALNSDDSEIRKAACLSLADTKSAEALLALRYIVKNDNDEFVILVARKSIEFMIDNAYEVITISEEKQDVVEKQKIIFQTI